jgi:hypothetical protein
MPSPWGYRLVWSIAPVCRTGNHGFKSRYPRLKPIEACQAAAQSNQRQHFCQSQLRSQFILGVWRRRFGHRPNHRSPLQFQVFVACCQETIEEAPKLPFHTLGVWRRVVGCKSNHCSPLHYLIYLMPVQVAKRLRRRPAKP